LDEDNKKNAEMMNKFMMSNQDPSVAAEMYNSMPFEDEYKFNKQKWTSTANGGRRDTPMATSTRAGADGALKPNEENTDAQMLGPDDGPIQFLRGYYKRDDKGQKILGDDGQPIFVETDTPVNYANKKAMNDAVSRMQDPKLRVAMTLKELGIDEFFSKEKGRRESSKQEHARSMELQDKKNKGNLAVAETSLIELLHMRILLQARRMSLTTLRVELLQPMLRRTVTVCQRHCLTTRNLLRVMRHCSHRMKPILFRPFSVCLLLRRPRATLRK
jgi:hypothetical protein